MSAARTRRQLLAGGLGAAAAGVAGALPGSAQGQTAERGQAASNAAKDAGVLQSLLTAERQLASACQKSLESGKLGPASTALVRLIMAHGQQHTGRLMAEMRGLRARKTGVSAGAGGSGGSGGLGGSGGSVGQSGLTWTFPVEQVADLFENIKSETVALQGLVQVENLVQHSYFSAAGSFYDPRLAGLAAEILACQAQEWSMLEGLLHRGDPTKVVPNPYVRGQTQVTAPHVTTPGS